MNLFRSRRVAALEAQLAKAQTTIANQRADVKAANREVQKLLLRTPERVERMCHQTPGHGGLHSAFDGSVWPTGRPPSSPGDAAKQGWEWRGDGWHWDPTVYPNGVTG